MWWLWFPKNITENVNDLIERLRISNVINEWDSLHPLSAFHIQRAGGGIQFNHIYSCEIQYAYNKSKKEKKKKSPTFLFTSFCEYLSTQFLFTNPYLTKSNIFHKAITVSHFIYKH